jgi:HD-GYP domain-containing protein (c-di-GMP phosphodiesterase class II)
MAVSLAVALSSGRRFLEVWQTNTLWVLGYDIAASGLAIVVAWFYTLFDSLHGFARLGFMAVFLPIILVKHVYGKLNTLQGLYDDLDAAHAKLERNMREQLAMMVKSIEARDPYTSGHSRRVAVLSRTIARDVGLPDDLVTEVENAALMHDVGKIHAEFAPLLSKEGKLTPEEWEIMKTHAVKGEELVAMFSHFHGTVQAVVRHHHERWDGLGYPDGVAGDRIPIGARIIMVADTIDAMTTERPYRKPLGFDVVIAELQKHRGTQFDPALVDRVVSSVSIRRLAATQGAPLANDGPPALSKPVSLRSHGSFFTGRRLNPGE